MTKKFLELTEFAADLAAIAKGTAPEMTGIHFAIPKSFDNYEAQSYAVGCLPFGTAQAFNDFVSALKENSTTITSFFIFFSANLSADEIKKLAIDEFIEVIAQKKISGTFGIGCGGKNIFAEKLNKLVDALCAENKALTSFNLLGHGSESDPDISVSLNDLAPLVVKHLEKLQSLNLFGSIFNSETEGSDAFLKALLSQDSNQITHIGLGTYSNKKPFIVHENEKSLEQLASLISRSKAAETPEAKLGISLSIKTDCADKVGTHQRFYDTLVSIKANKLYDLCLDGDFENLDNLHTTIQKQDQIFRLRLSIRDKSQKISLCLKAATNIKNKLGDFRLQNIDLTNEEDLDNLILILENNLK